MPAEYIVKMRTTADETAQGEWLRMGMGVWQLQCSCRAVRAEARYSEGRRVE